MGTYKKLKTNYLIDMRLITIPLYTLIMFGIFACDKDDDSTEKQTVENFIFEDGFETQDNSVNELFPSNGSRWSSIQQSDPTDATNEISISDINFSEGRNALRLLAFRSDNSLSKMDIEKNGFSAFKGDRVLIKADFFIGNTANIENLLLIDLECCSCWDPTANVENQCPGVRLKMSGGNDFLSIERGKIAESTIEQTSFPFPRNEWVNVQWEMTLSDTDNGMNKVLINGTEVVNSSGTNMPNAQTFRAIFAQEGIDFTLQEPAFYERVQIGATANPTAENIELFIDNFSIVVEKNVP